MVQEIRIQVSPSEWDESAGELSAPAGLSMKGPIEVKRYGADAGSALGFIVQVVGSVSASLIAAYLYDYFKNHRSQRITISSKLTIKHVVVDRQEIEKRIGQVLEEYAADEHALDDLIGDGFVLTLPLFSCLIEPGPRPGFLRDPKTRILFIHIVDRF